MKQLYYQTAAFYDDQIAIRHKNAYQYIYQLVYLQFSLCSSSLICNTELSFGTYTQNNLDERYNNECSG